MARRFEVYDLHTGDAVTEVLTEREAQKWIDDESDNLNWDAYDYYGIREVKQ